MKVISGSEGVNADTLEGKKASEFALKTEIPTSLPANGGNANTVGTVGISDIIQKRNDLGTLRMYYNLGGYTREESVTGAIVITGPKNMSSTMIMLEIMIYSYSMPPAGGCTTLGVSGYAYGQGSWINYGSTSSNKAMVSSIKLGVRGGKPCIIIGAVTDTWGYPKIMLSKLMAGYSNQNEWDGLWDIRITTDLSDITALVSTTVA